MSNGKVVEIRYNYVGGVPGYDVVLAKGSQVSFRRFAKPSGGLVVLADKTEPAWMRHWKGREDRAWPRTRSAKVKLADAVRDTAEARPRARAGHIAAGMAQSATSGSTDVKAYNVAILKDGAQLRVAIDSDTGSVIADPSALAPY